MPGAHGFPFGFRTRRSLLAVCRHLPSFLFIFFHSLLHFSKTYRVSFHWFLAFFAKPPGVGSQIVRRLIFSTGSSLLSLIPISVCKDEGFHLVSDPAD